MNALKAGSEAKDGAPPINKQKLQKRISPFRSAPPGVFFRNIQPCTYHHSTHYSAHPIHHVLRWSVLMNDADLLLHFHSEKTVG
jgi:hypothetical protein